MTPVMLRVEALAKSFTLHLRGGVRIPVLDGVGLPVSAWCWPGRRGPASRR
jgi:alpha-D-ribose 1-methylphosphonate 5-triphosphate synthase subunit PhnL